MKKTLFKNINTVCIGCIILESVRVVFISLEQHLSGENIVLFLYRKKIETVLTVFLNAYRGDSTL